MREARAFATHVWFIVRMAWLRASGRRAGVAVMYHRVAPEPGDASHEFVPALAVADFEAQLAHLRRWYRVVPAAELQASAARRRRGERYPVAVTFDDDTDTHLHHAVPCLRSHGVPATFFLNGREGGRSARYWWEELQAARDGGARWDDLLEPATLARACEVAGGPLTPYAISVAVEELDPGGRAALVRTAARPGAGLRDDEVAALARSGEIGFHGARHEPMALLDDGALAAELEGGRDALAAATGGGLTMIAYPHGRADARVADAARARGFVTGFTVRAAAVTPHDDPLLLGRVDGAVSPAALRGALLQALGAAS